MDLIPQLIAKRHERIQRVQSIGGFWIIIAAMLVLSAVAVSLLGGTPPENGPISLSPTPTPTPTESHAPRIYTVSYKAGVFSPTNLRIHSGDTVRFKNDGILSVRIVSDPHPDHNDLVGFDSIGDIPPGSSFIFTFAAKGVFGYHNEKKISEIGTVMVK